MFSRRVRPAAAWSGSKFTTRGNNPRALAADCLPPPIMKHLPLLPVEEEGRLNDLRLRENFIERVFAYRRWQDALGEHPARSTR